MLKKVLSAILCVLILFTLLSFNTVSATETEEKKEKCVVYLDTVTAKTGDFVIVSLNIKNNPGIMAMTISITYDSSALTYKRYYYGDVFEDYTLAAHPTRNIIRLVISETKDLHEDGTIIRMRFQVAEKATAELHEMTVKYSSGDFCNNDLERIMPEIQAGGVEVEYNGSNCPHRSYGEWKESFSPTCTDNGAEQRECIKCGHVEIRDTEPLGHTYSDKWTVDVPATKENPGSMSRHCIRCSATTDETTFTLEQSEDSGIDNTPDAEVPKNDKIDSIIEEQNPGAVEEVENMGKKPEKKPDNNKNNSDENDKDKSEENNKTDEQIKDIIEALTPDKDSEAAEEQVLNIIEKLREAIPQLNTLINIFEFFISILILIVLL